MRRLFTAIATAIVSATLMVHGQSPVAGQTIDNLTTLWFVQLSSPPAIDGTQTDALDREGAAFDEAARGDRIRYQVRRRFTGLFNGVSLRASATDAARLRTLPGVTAVYPVQTVSLPPVETTPGTSLDLITALTQTGADVAQSELGLTGRGVRVAIIDTGIDYDNPDLGGCFGPGCRVEKGYDFVGDDYNAADVDPVIAPDPDPDDCAGHGTHVAGIVGANGEVVGVAPEVTFLAYRVFGCEGSTSEDIILAAMERAWRDGADVINMSLGHALDWPQSIEALAVDRLVRHGVVVAASAGNDATLGLYATSTPATAAGAISVASFDNTAAHLTAFAVSPDGTLVGYIEAAGAPLPPESGSAPMARTGTSSSTADACNPLPANSLAGMVALIRRGTCSFYAKAFNAQTAGAIGVVLYNNAPGILGVTVAGTPPITIPVVSITAAKGVLIDARLSNGPVTLTLTTEITAEPIPTANLISSFSSYGPAPDLSIKPDIGAPGGSVRSTLPLEQGGHGTLSGTSMASPHVAGAAALLLQARPRLKPADVMMRMQNTAVPQLWSGNPTVGILDSVHRQGAGMLRVDSAVLAEATVSPSELALGEVENGVALRLLRIDPGSSFDDDGGHDRRGGRKDGDTVTYRLGHQPGVSTGANTFAPEPLGSFATVNFSSPTVTLHRRGKGNGNGNGDSEYVAVAFVPPASAATRLFGGYITLTPDDGGPVLRVPYLGYNGDYQAIPVMTLAGFPALAALTPTGLGLLPNGGTFTLEGSDVPFILLHLNHQVQNLKLEVFDAATGESLRLADDENFLPRNSTATSLFLFAWDGTTARRQNGRRRDVPNGTYRLELTVLKALGDPRNPAHVEKWTSPNITIARPQEP